MLTCTSQTKNERMPLSKIDWIKVKYNKQKVDNISRIEKYNIPLAYRQTS